MLTKVVPTAAATADGTDSAGSPVKLESSAVTRWNSIRKSVTDGNVGGVRLSRSWRTGLGNVKTEDVLAAWQGTTRRRSNKVHPGPGLDTFGGLGGVGLDGAVKPSISKFVAEVDEGLEANWRDTPWVVPSVARAHEHRRYAMFASGHAPVWSTTMRDMAAFGGGIYLYMRLLRALAILFSVMTVLSIPAYMFSSAGSRIPAEDLDALTLSLVSIGNIGDSLATSAVGGLSIQNGTASADSGDSAATVTMPAVIWDPSARISAKDGAVVVVVLDLACCMGLVVLMVWLANSIDELERGGGKETLSASDYTVFVRGLPADATRKEIVEHFSTLYALDRPDWEFPGYCGCCHMWSKKARLPSDITDGGRMVVMEDGEETLVEEVVERHPTANCDNTRKPDVYAGTWIAECTVVHPNTKLIEKFKHQKKALKKLKEARAHAKRYAKGTPDPNGPDDAKFDQWAKKVEELEGHHDEAAKVVKRMSHALGKKHPHEMDCSGAFVTFQHEESFIRCLNDYRRSAHFIGRLLQPDVLRFRPDKASHIDAQGLQKAPERIKKLPLRVEQADEPTNIIWEHLNTPDHEVLVRRYATIVPCVLLLVVMMLTVFYVQNEATAFKDTVPSLASCDLDVPATYIGSYERVSEAQKQLAKAAETGEDNGALHSILDPYYDKDRAKAECPNPQKEYWISFSNSSLNGTGWDATARLQAASEGPATNVTSACVRPCVQLNDRTPCESLACSLGKDMAQLCRKFTRNSIVGCYCKRTFERIVEQDGFSSSTLDRFAEETEEVCATFLASFLAVQSLSLGMSFLVVVVNGVLRVTLTLLARCEHHHSEGAESAAVSFKVFTAMFMNTGLTILLVNSALQNYMPP